MHPEFDKNEYKRGIGILQDIECECEVEEDHFNQLHFFDIDIDKTVKTRKNAEKNFLKFILDITDS